MAHELEFAGRNATWVFERDAVRIDYRQGFLDSVLLRALGSRRVPHAAIADVTVSGGSKAPTLSLTLDRGSDPLLELAAGQLADHEQPYRLAVDPKKADLAPYHRDQLLEAVAAAREGGPPTGFLLDAPAPPQRLRGFDGWAALDAAELRLSWNDEAELAKQRAGERVHRLAAIRSVEWQRPGVMSGLLRVRGTEPTPPGQLDEHDPDVLLFGMGYGSIGDTLPFAMALLAAVGRAAPTGPAVAAGDAHAPAPTGTDDVVARLEALARLRDSGVLEPGEFEAKKKELLDRL